MSEENIYAVIEAISNDRIANNENNKLTLAKELRDMVDNKGCYSGFERLIPPMVREIWKLSAWYLENGE